MDEAKKDALTNENEDTAMLDFLVRQANAVANLQYQLTIKNLEISRLQKHNQGEKVETEQDKTVEASQNPFEQKPLPTYSELLQRDEVVKPHYGFCVHQAALLAKDLKYDKISVIEFGVGRGLGLLNLEYHANEIEKELGVKIDVYGFDMETGLPKPIDYRDMPYIWQEGFYKMNKSELEKKLQRTKLVLGDVKNTISEFCKSYSPAPIGAIMFDLDYYSSTMDALRIFDENSDQYLPRVFCYFDDLVGDEFEIFHEYAGELLAISDFNKSHDFKKLAQINGLRFKRKLPMPWNEQIFVFHDFKHPKYNEYCYPRKSR